ncbi:sigma-70 family RNA polymerase sigma factor [Pseudomonas sp. R2.Fl]|nr:sigma-70 family RNA polymerase sigma factor [Pseudomonas sp. R2.Fl]
MEHVADMAEHARQGFAEQLERHRGIVFKVAGTYCRNPDDRAELAQEIASQLWQAYPRFDPARPFSTWMYRIALNVAISFVRDNSRRHRHAVPLDDQLHDIADPHAADPQAEQQIRALHRFIHTQAPLDRALLLLYLEDRAYRDISEILGISETNVATKISRLKQRIRNEL